MSETTIPEQPNGYTDGMDRASLPHPTSKYQPGVIVRHRKNGTQLKVMFVDHMTNQFTAHGGTRTQFHMFDDYDVLDGQEYVLNSDDPEVMIAEAERNLERLRAQRKATAEAEARNAEAIAAAAPKGKAGK